MLNNLTLVFFLIFTLSSTISTTTLAGQSSKKVQELLRKKARLNKMLAQEQFLEQDPRLVPPIRPLPTDPASGAECFQFIKSLPPEYTWSTLVVPEDASNPTGPQTRVFYYSRPAEGHPFNFGTPLIYFNGGPGMHSHTSSAMLDKIVEYRKIPLIFLDQRGTGCSQKLPAEDTRKLHYRSRGIVQDAEAIRKRLLGPDRKWRIFGQSFGGLVVHRYLEIAPEGVDAAISHGMSVMKDSTTAFYNRISMQAWLLKCYFVLYPQDEELLAGIKRSLLKNKEVSLVFSQQDIRAYKAMGISIQDLKIPSDLAVELLNAYYIALSFYNHWPLLHEELVQLSTSEGALTFKNYPLLFSFFSSDLESASVLAEHMADVDLLVTCDAILANNRELFKDSLNECNFYFAKMHFLLLLAPHFESQLSASSQTPVDPISLERIAEQLKLHPTLQFHLYSSLFDGLVPHTTFDEEAKILGDRIHYVRLHGSGHEGYITEPEIAKQVTTTINTYKGD